MSKAIITGLLLTAALFLSGCSNSSDTQNKETIAARAYKASLEADMKSSGNWIAKRIGGSAHITLPPNHKLVTLTWKQDALWVLYRPFRDGEKPEYYVYKEDSKFGLIEGTVIIKEEAYRDGNNVRINQSANGRCISPR